MALLDYMFPMEQSSSSITGLLGEDEAKKIRQQSQMAGLLNFGVNLLANSGPTSQPMSFGQRLAPAILGGYQAAQGATNQQLQDQLAMQKMQREAGFRKAIGGAFSMSPSAEGIRQTQSNIDPGLLEGMSAQQVIGAAPKTERVLDENKFMSALGEYFPLEFAKMQASRQRSEKESFKPMSADEKRSAGLPVDRPYQISTSGKIQDIGTGPQSVVNVLPAEGERQKGYGKYGVEKNTQIFDAGQKAVQNIGKINETLNLLEQGNATTGLGADIINNINRTQVLFTGSKKKINEVSDTELLNSLLGADVFPQIGALGIGAKGLDTPAEREFLRQVMTGTINMNKETLLRLTKLRKKYEERSLGDYNKAVDEGQLDELFRFSGLPKRKLTAPTTAITVNY